ncbi:MAG: hypothetical protein R3220_08775 [Balneolaceae bacterium]|nr:hypothetical protein [Balneolaceae bacterium]
MKKLPGLLIILSLFISESFAQDVEENLKTNTSENLRGTHAISLLVGYQDITNNAVTVTPTEIDVSTHVIGFLRYQYWPEDHSSFSISAGVFSSKTNVRFFRAKTTRIIPILMGYTFYPGSLSVGKAGRFFVGANIGTYIHSVSDVNVGFFGFGSQSETKAVFGAEIHTGMDFFVSKWIKLGPQLSWHSLDNYRGPAISVSLGILL